MAYSKRRNRGVCIANTTAAAAAADMQSVLTFQQHSRSCHLKSTTTECNQCATSSINSSSAARPSPGSFYVTQHAAPLQHALPRGY